MSSYEELAKAMYDKSVLLDKHLDNLKTLNSELRDRSKKILDSLSELVGHTKHPSKTCNVCYSRPQPHAMLPCGHFGMCFNCAIRSKDRGRCPVCRADIEQIVKIYVG